jgi:hypothetical protein
LFQIVVLNNNPLVDPNYLVAEVDHHIHPQDLRKLAGFVGSISTESGKDVLNRQIVPPEVESLSINFINEILNASIRARVERATH